MRSAPGSALLFSIPWDANSLQEFYAFGKHSRECVLHLIFTD